MSQFRRPGYSGWWLCDRDGNIVPDPTGPVPHRIDPNLHPVKVPPPEPKGCPHGHDADRMAQYGKHNVCLECQRERDILRAPARAAREAMRSA